MVTTYIGEIMKKFKEVLGKTFQVVLRKKLVSYRILYRNLVRILHKFYKNYE